MGSKVVVAGDGGAWVNSPLINKTSAQGAIASLKRGQGVGNPSQEAYFCRIIHVFYGRFIVLYIV
jgi:hypothetical protein